VFYLSGLCFGHTGQNKINNFETMALYDYYLLEQHYLQADAQAAAHAAGKQKSDDSSKTRSAVPNKKEVATAKLPEAIWPADNPSDHLAF
jgi:hypothetical protein